MSKRFALSATWTTAVAVSALLVISVFTLLDRDTRQDIDLADFTHASSEVPALYGYEVDTDELCRGVSGCVQGYKAAHASFRKFDSKEGAASYASSSTDSYLSNWIVIEYIDETLTRADKRQIEEIFDTTATSD